MGWEASDGVGRLQMVWGDVRWGGETLDGVERRQPCCAGWETPATLRWLGNASYAPLAGKRQLRSAGWEIRLVF